MAGTRPQQRAEFPVEVAQSGIMGGENTVNRRQTFGQRTAGGGFGARLEEGAGAGEAHSARAGGWRRTTAARRTPHPASGESGA